MGRKVKCHRCGFDGSTDGLFAMLFDSGKRWFFSCKSPLCDLEGVTFCKNCMKDLGAGEWPSKCPRCNIGAIKNHGQY